MNDLPLPSDLLAGLVDLALREDLNTPSLDATADLTAAWVVPAQARATATLIARRPGILAGLDLARLVFQRLDPSVVFTPLVAEGSQVRSDQQLIQLAGPARALLTGERTALNFLQHLSGVATLTHAHVQAISGTRAHITDTRKTTPGLRLLEKYAVRLGGGVNHRFGLYDAVLIKENHAATVGGVAAAVQRARQAAQATGVRIMVEARNVDEARSVAALSPQRILLDNMSLAAMRQAVPLIRQADPRIEIEATGDVALHNVRDVALTGVDFISIGALTHSAPALNLSLLFVLE